MLISILEIQVECFKVNLLILGLHHVSKNELSQLLYQRQPIHMCLKQFPKLIDALKLRHIQLFDIL